MARIGLLGGSFNPAHGGHRAISVNAIAALGLDEVWWLVSPGNPLKSKKGMAPLAARLVSAEKQARNARIRPTVIEAELGTRRRTVDVRAGCLVNRAQTHALRGDAARGLADLGAAEAAFDAEYGELGA